MNKKIGSSEDAKMDNILIAKAEIPDPARW